VKAWRGERKNARGHEGVSLLGTFLTHMSSLCPQSSDQNIILDGVFITFLMSSHHINLSNPPTLRYPLARGAMKVGSDVYRRPFPLFLFFVFQNQKGGQARCLRVINPPIKTATNPKRLNFTA
jgi:hypothetical protein